MHEKEIIDEKQQHIVSTRITQHNTTRIHMPTKYYHTIQIILNTSQDCSNIEVFVNLMHAHN